jgi:hypothetical protein
MTYITFLLSYNIGPYYYSQYDFPSIIILLQFDLSTIYFLDPQKERKKERNVHCFTFSHVILDKEEVKLCFVGYNKITAAGKLSFRAHMYINRSVTPKGLLGSGEYYRNVFFLLCCTKLWSNYE